MKPSLLKPSTIAAVTLDPDPDPPPLKSTSSPGFLWKNLFADVDSSTFPSSSPSYLPDGTPIVLAPQSVILQASSTWAGHLLCRFLGEPPSPAKFFSDLNRVWGKHGDISVRRFSSGTFLVYVPSSSTRKWILQTGLWSSGTVSFVVSEWSVNPSLATPPKLTSATTVLTIREIPPQLWSHEAVARIAGGVAKLIPGTRASLPLSSLGTATIRAIVPLGSPLPSSVLVKDSYGESVLVSVEYGRLPHLCSNCNSYGHQMHRCPLRHSVVIPIPPKSTSNFGKNSELEPTPVPDLIPEIHRETMDLDHDITPLNSSLIKSPLQAPVTVAQVMDLDNKDCEELISKCTSESHPVPVSSPPPTDEVPQVTSSSPQVDPELMQAPLCPSTPTPIPSESHPHCDITPLNSSLIKSPVQVPETVAQVMDLDNKACEELPSNCTSVSHPLHVSSPPSTDILQQVTSSSSSPQVGPRLMQALLCSSTPTLTSSESLAANIESTNPCKEHNSNLIINSDPTPTIFSFPPPVVHALETKTDHLSPPSFPDMLPLIQYSQETMIAKCKKAGNRDKTQDKLATDSYLRCKMASFQFKPREIVEKRRKKAQNDLLPEAEELHHFILELQSDKKDTTYYEALRAHKILRNSESATNEALET